MDISIVVPTRNRSVRAGELIRLLDAQANAERLEVEIVVVDDAGTPSHRDHLRAIAAPLRRVRYVELGQRLGAGAARNAGLKNASGSIVAFLDDDVVPDKSYIRALSAEHQLNPEALVINGILTPAKDDVFSRFWFDRYKCVFGGLERTFGEVQGLASGHFSIKRSCLESVSPLFDERLPAREDFDLYIRLKSAGISCYRSSKIAAQNCCPESLWELARQRAWYARGEYHLRKKYGENHVLEEERRVGQLGGAPRVGGKRYLLLELTISAAIEFGFTREALRFEPRRRDVVAQSYRRMSRAFLRRIGRSKERSSR